MARHDLLDYGAAGDGTTLDTAAVQAAIDAAHDAGGGTMVVSAGRTFLIGSIELRSRVELHLEPGSVLQGSPHWADYTARFRVGALSAGVVSEGTETSAALVTARDAEQVLITGSGVIDGAGAAFVHAEDGDIYRLSNERPFLAFLIGCSNLTISGVTLRDSALWTLRLTGCEDVLVHGIRIRADVRMPNSDGIDLDRCARVRISDCDIECGDDAISLKTCDEWPEYGACEDITVTGCTLATRSSALVVGVDVSAPIRNVIFSSCVVRVCHRGLAVTIGTGEKGDIENVLFSDIVVQTRLSSPNWWGSGEAIFVRAAPWHDQVGRIRQIRFRNVLARGEGGAVIFGAVPGLVSDVTLDGVRLELERTTDWPARRDLRPYADGGPHEVKLPGILVEQAAGVVLRDCEIAYAGERREDFGPMISIRQAPDLLIDGLRGQPAHPGLARIEHL